MAASINPETAAPAGFTQIPIRSYEGVSYRRVSTNPPRDCTPEEIPIIDLNGIFNDDLEARTAVAREMLHAAESSGFFYIKNHGIPEDVIANALEKSKEFFRLPVEEKRKVASPNTSYGYHGLREGRANPFSSADVKESFTFHYHPSFDPLHRSSPTPTPIPPKVLAHLPQDDAHIWPALQPADCRRALTTHWAHALALARRLIRVLALGLGLREDHFDGATAYPGADMAVNHYPGGRRGDAREGGEAEEEQEQINGLGAHTDLQILTLLWQQRDGLQVLNARDEWVRAPPVPGALVVNVGDFLMRLTNDRLRSTVHRVVMPGVGEEDRFSIPFFFGFNFDEKLGVLPTCVNEANPAKYEPVTCGELIAKRLALG